MNASFPILIIEDDPMIARALCRALQQAGRRFECVSDCEQTYRLAGPFSSAIIDLHLPDGTGFEVYEWLMDHQLICGAVFFTATTQAQEIERARESGVYVAKSEGAVRAVEEALRLERTAEFNADPPESETRPSTPQMPVTRVVGRDTK